ncbi:MAG: prenyltransferase/squalene oxidase repeat-containing protein [Planctomycetota bacterium]
MSIHQLSGHRGFDSWSSKADRREALKRLIIASLGLTCAARVIRADEPPQQRLPITEDLFIADRVDQAIDSGIEALLERQRQDGAIADRGHATAMTSMAIMALASIGVTPEPTTPRGRAISRALEFVLQPKNQMRGYFGHHDGSRMYGHGITTLMLTEMLGMGATVYQNERIHDALASALKVILASQQVSKSPKDRGGWRYTPDARDSDLSVSVWQVMALRSAKNDGLDVPSKAIEAAIDYLRFSYTSPLKSDGSPRDVAAGFAYTPGNKHPSFTMTAAGLLALQTCGQYDSPLVRGASQWLLQHPPKSNSRFFFYGMYYFAQGMHQVGGDAAATANRLVPELLLPMQSKQGHWSGTRGEERNIGVVYATALAILSLSVRYHYLPIYQR